MTYLERLAVDADLQAFVQAEIVRAGIDAQSWKVAARQKDQDIARLKQRIAELEEAHEPKQRRKK